MIEQEAISDPQTDSLRDRLDQLERETQDLRLRSEERVIQAEMKVEAMRAGMVDLDGLKFLELNQLRLDENGSVSGGQELIGQLRRAKPWLFAAPTSSSMARVPASKPARVKLVSEMTDEEYRVARANVIRRTAY